MLPLSSSPSSYGTYQQVNTHGAEPACPLVPFGMSLSNVVQRSRVLLTEIRELELRNEALWSDSGRLNTGELKQHVSTLVAKYTHIVEALFARLERRAGDWFVPGDHDALHQEIAQLFAFSQALDHALKGTLTEAESAALDRYFPPPPTCGSMQVVCMTGMGCTLLGGVGVVTGGILLVEDDRAGLAVTMGGMAASLVAVGLLTARSIYHRCKTVPAPDPEQDVKVYSEEWCVLGEVNQYMKSQQSQRLLD